MLNETWWPRATLSALGKDPVRVLRDPCSFCRSNHAMIRGYRSAIVCPDGRRRYRSRRNWLKSANRVKPRRSVMGTRCDMTRDMTVL